MLKADERKIKQVIFNLLSNAVKFTPEGGRVQLTARQMDGYLQIGVHDTGIGIAPEDQARIFEEFQQARGERPDATEGTGLGLALARRFVELHGGALWVESAVGAGSTFTLTLPSDLSVAQPLQVDLNGPAPLPAEVPVRSRRRT